MIGGWLARVLRSPQRPRPAMVVCGDCGTANEPTNRRCRNCGALL